MKRKAFTGWRHIFDFTWKQAVELKGFKTMTIALAVILLVVGVAISLLMALGQKNSDTKLSPVETVHIADESELGVLFLDGFAEMHGERYPALKFVLEEDVQQMVSSLGAIHPNDLIVKITREESGYLVKAIIPDGSQLHKSDAEEFLDDFQVCMEQSKLLSSGIEQEKLLYAISGVSSELMTAGDEEKSVGELLVGMLLPMIVVFALYMMTLLYGQSIINIVSVEKTSKLMEQMLTMTRPEALIFGKISATVAIALLQLVLWLVCFVGGFFGGDILAKELIYPEYNNVILEVFALMQGQDGSTAFTIGAVVLFIVSMCLGFLFFCVIAGLVASFASKTEEIAMSNAYYQMAVIAGFVGAYILPLQEQEWINNILRIVPVTSAFLLPGDILVGNVTVLQGLGYLAILLAFTLVLIVVAGRVYKSQVLNKGMSVFERFKKKKA